MAIVDFAVFAVTAAFAELFVYKYMCSEGRFKVSGAEKLHISNRIQKISQMSSNELVNITREVRDSVAEKCEYQPVKQMLQYVWGLSEEISDQIADKYGTRFSEKSKNAIDKNLAIFAESYSKGFKLETYDSIANLFHDFLSKKGEEELDRGILARELKITSESLARGSPTKFLDVLSKYVQRPFKQVDVLLFMNAINDIVYRVKSQLLEGPTYYDFLRSISKDIKHASKAIVHEDTLLLYEAYEHIFQKAWARVEKVDRLQRRN
ncbi:MAG: hypothetical protein QXZ70_00875 [Candidatus Bathyarchaeia archaeon]